MKNLNKLFNPKSIAIVGASPKKEKLGYILAQNIEKGGWKGNLYFVNPKHKKIGEKKCFTSLSAIKKPIDLALVAIPASFVNQAIEDGVTSRPKIENFIVISAGFKEAGEKGKAMEEDLKILAKNKSLNILGPNCLGFINPPEKLNATFTSGNFQNGKVAVISQSGALAVALLDWAECSAVGFSKAISIGNKAVLNENDVLEFVGQDKNTQAAALYIEDIQNGPKFLEIAGKITQKKPVIALKAGKNQAGQKAISSHTGSLAQDEAILESIFEKINIIEAKTEEEFQNLILFLSSGKIPESRDVIVLTNAGGPGALASDFIGGSKNLKLLRIPSKMKSELKKILPGNASVENPIDIIGDATPARYDNALQIISHNFPRSPILVILTPQSQTDPENVAQILKKFKKNLPSLEAAFMGGKKVKKACRFLHQNGIPAFENPEEALLAFEKLATYSARKKSSPKFSPAKNIRLKLKTNALVQAALLEKRKMLFWEEAAEIFRSYGVKIAKSLSFQKLSEINLNNIIFPCVLKTDDPKIIHRWDKKAVILGIKDEKSLQSALRKMQKGTGAKNFLIQTMAPHGLEMIFGLKRDPSFGPVIVSGWGGTFTEIFKDSAIFIPPLTPDEIKNKLNGLKISPILHGFRGEKGYSLKEIGGIILALQAIAAENPDISQIDINPAVLYNKGKHCEILDAKIYL